MACGGEQTPLAEHGVFAGHAPPRMPSREAAPGGSVNGSVSTERSSRSSSIGRRAAALAGWVRRSITPTRIRSRSRASSPASSSCDPFEGSTPVKVETEHLYPRPCWEADSKPAEAHQNVLAGETALEEARQEDVWTSAPTMVAARPPVLPGGIPSMSGAGPVPIQAAAMHGAGSPSRARQAGGVETALAAAVADRLVPGSEDQTVLDRLESRITQLNMALRAPNLTSMRAYTIRKELTQRRAERARAERAVRQGRRAAAEIAEDVRSAWGIHLSPEEDSSAPLAADASVALTEATADDAADPPGAPHLRTTSQRLASLVAETCAHSAPPSSVGRGKPLPMETVMSVLLHPQVLLAAGYRTIFALAFTAKAFKASILDGESEARAVDTAWSCICRAFAVELGLWYPSQSSQIQRSLFQEQLWPARRKWHASSQEQSGQTGTEASDFRIQVSARFKPGDLPRVSKLLVPLHQRIALMRKEGGQNLGSICRQEPPEYQDALLGTLMQDPVRLPTSGKTCERRIIEDELSRNGGRDPFNSRPLHRSDLEPLEELRGRIRSWKAASIQAAGDAQQIDDEQIKKLIEHMGGELDPALVEMIMEADQLRNAGNRAVREVVRTEREEQQRLEEQAAEEDAEAGNGEAEEENAPDEGPRPWWEAGPQRPQGAGAQRRPAADRREEEVGDAPQRDGQRQARLLAVVPPTRVAMFQPGAGIRSLVFTHVFDGDAAQTQVYEDVARGSVCSAMNGFNACLFCYGQTGSGKTHTMFGERPQDAQNASVVREQTGCVLRAIRDLLRAGKDMQAAGIAVKLSAQYVQIYNDQVSCLSSGRPVSLRELVSGAPVMLQGAEEIHLQELGDVLEMLARGEELKRYAETAMNHRSSRAHTVLAIKVEQWRGELALTSNLHLVDLAGSERVKKSRAQGTKFVEAVGINSSLMVLGKCIAARVAERPHVPYYESQLTLLLRSALGGNSRTSVIICCHKEEVHGDETLQALNFGQRCAALSNKASAAIASSTTEAAAAVDSALAECAKQIAGLEARGKGQLPACAKLRSRHATLARRRAELCSRCPGVPSEAQRVVLAERVP
mmetsp:Transcript_26473/g.61729  ORF Transcript_26473/g.61729 Transcript_26473/m.61729 type:complete len:1081 (-) Transcript_26473:8-3250(-)